jgi:hypothetical protein
VTAAIAVDQPVPLVPGPTDYYPAIPGPRNALLDMLRNTRSMCVEFYDPDGAKYGMPTYPWRASPDGWLTKRQLRARGLRPGGQLPAGQVMWRHHGKRRHGYLYLESLALPVREMTPAMWHRHFCMMAARQTCPSCGHIKPYCIPRSLGECNECADLARSAA